MKTKARDIVVKEFEDQFSSFFKKPSDYDLYGVKRSIKVFITKALASQQAEYRERLKKKWLDEALSPREMYLEGFRDAKAGFRSLVEGMKAPRPGIPLGTNTQDYNKALDQLLDRLDK